MYLKRASKHTENLPTNFLSSCFSSLEIESNYVIEYVRIYKKDYEKIIQLYLLCTYFLKFEIFKVYHIYKIRRLKNSNAK